MSKGRNIFIFGERGVGKTSLAKTAANQYQSSDREFIDVSCAPDTRACPHLALHQINMQAM